MTDIVAAVALLLAIVAVMWAVIGGAAWLYLRFEAWALDRGWIEEERSEE